MLLFRTRFYGQPARDDLDPSRRNILKAACCIAGTASLSGLAGAALADGSKLPKAEVGYRDAPRGSARCDRCVQFKPPAACGIVDGPVSPAGSCNLFAPKPR